MKLWLIGAFGNPTPFWDQWDGEAALLYGPYVEGTLAWSQLVAPHNEHRILFTRLLGLWLLEANGIWNPLLQMVVNASIHVAVIAAAAWLLTRDLRRNDLAVALIYAFALFAVPYAWENTLAAFQSQFYLLIAFSLGAIWFTSSGEVFAPRWWIGFLLAAGAFFCLASGAMTFLVIAFLALLRFAAERPHDKPQLWAAAAGIAAFALAYGWTPAIAGHAALRAADPVRFYEAAVTALAFPLQGNLAFGLVRNVPWLVLLLVVGRARRVAAGDAFALGLGAWAAAQSLAIAYGRGVDVQASRYLDMFAIGALANFGCALRLLALRPGAGLPVAVMLWGAIVLVGLGMRLSSDLPRELASKRQLSQLQQAHTRAFLETGDVAHLKGKPFLAIPYPDPDRLAMILGNPHVRAILPGAISAGMPAEQIQAPEGLLVPHGYYPSTPRTGSNAWGTYGSTGDGATGEARLRFVLPVAAGYVSLPVAGYPFADGIGVSVQQDGRTHPIRGKENPRESWQRFDVRLEKGPFEVVLADQSTKTWVAVAAPVAAGRFDASVLWLLANPHWLAAVALLALMATVTGRVRRVAP